MSFNWSDVFYRRALNIEYNSGNKYGFGNGIFLLEKLNCTGSESSVFQCGNIIKKEHWCRPRQNIAGIVCAEDRGKPSEFLSVGHAAPCLVFLLLTVFSVPSRRVPM